MKLLTDTKTEKISSEIYGIRKPYLTSVFWPRESAYEQHPAGTSAICNLLPMKLDMKY